MTLHALRRPNVLPAHWSAHWPLGIAWVVLSIALVAALIAAAGLGAVKVQASDWSAPFRDEALSGSAHVLWQLRLPRVLLAAVIGATLGLCGALTQGLFRNPLADPGLLGVSTGAACAVALALTVFSGAQVALPPAWRFWMLPVCAFAGALGVCIALERVARWLTPGSLAGLLLTGLALNAITTSIIGLCSYLATDEQLRSLTFWTLGSLAGASWMIVGVVGAALLIGAWRTRRLGQALNALALGESAAGHVGVDVPRLRAELIVVIALLSALAVAWCGFIGFIGLMSPHLVRGFAGADQRRVLPLSMMAGALLLIVADTIARTAAVPAEIPVGIFTALIGGPGFLLLLRAAVRQQGGPA